MCRASPAMGNPPKSVNVMISQRGNIFAIDAITILLSICMHVFVTLCNVGAIVAVAVLQALLEKNLVGGNTFPSVFSSYPSISLS